MKLARLALISLALASFAFAAKAQTSTQPQTESSGYQGCSSRSKPAATS